ncbi:hypothetical protein LRD69_08905 [Streptomyces sp. JH14]|uniref:hypothetical protein n=1 Tax=Streptomyces sp. JH14 TaxID=2793630 RepID=UPI0023F92D1E|nr:hypothetical protein [Streptomyces sp. JH14]MDF6042280.1 hypothetical protein [Streptomyces sp. JH14]
MTSSDHLLDLIQSRPDIQELLRSSFSFDIERKRCGDGLRLASGRSLEPIAGEFAGGAYLLCTEENGRQPVVFASSEGKGGLIADDLAGALEIIIGLAWQDCLGFSGGGNVKVMQVSAQHLERSLARDNPEIAEERAAVAAALSLRVVSVADLVIRLQEAASRTEPDYVVVDEDGQAYGSPFGEYSEPRLGGWR